MDRLTTEQRSERMSCVRGKDTKPEMLVRRLVHGQGYRYRLHARDIPGCPDIVFSKRKKAIFVHGCYWRRHRGCPLARMPKSRIAFWESKLNGNRERDILNLQRLTEMGWECLVVWECELKDKKALQDRTMVFLEGNGAVA
ncbi:MAG: very short patch repair endonuclease [Syntrophobacteraceae bacterium]|nr:very short patch repair endonuclease [Syntrophobacteraceae bacterium]